MTGKTLWKENLRLNALQNRLAKTILSDLGFSRSQIQAILNTLLNVCALNSHKWQHKKEHLFHDYFYDLIGGKG